jgi:hypothetical protein
MTLAPAPSHAVTDLAPAVDDLAWLLPGAVPTPADALRRIRTLCERCPDLYSALLTVVVTHQGLRVDRLATAVRQFRPDLATLTDDDVAGLLKACWNGGWQGFDAVWRARQRDKGQGGGRPSWLKPDD